MQTATEAVDLQGEEQTGEPALANGNAQPAEKEAAVY